MGNGSGGVVIPDEEVQAEIPDHEVEIEGSASSDPLTQQTQAAAPKTSTKPFFEKPPVGTPFPSTNPIEKSGQRADLLARRQQRASQSPTPFSNAMQMLSPVAAARQIVGGKTGAYVGSKVAPRLGFTPEQGEVAGGAAGSFIAGVSPKVVEMPTPTIEAPETINLPGGFKIHRNIPPPPEPEEEVQFKKAKTITEAQEAAQTEHARRTKIAESDAQKSAKAKTAAYQKDAEEHMAIQKRHDDAIEERMKAEKAVKNSKVQGKDHEALVRAAQKASQSEDSIKKELKKSQAKVDVMPPGARPTASEQFLTNLTKKSILTPEEDAQGQRYFGEKWNPRKGEGPQGRIARLLGLVRAGRSAVGMQDTSFGPMTPPPEPTAPSGRNPIASPSALEESSAQLRKRFDPEGKLTDAEVATKAKKAQRRTLEDMLGITQPVGEE